MDPVEDAGSGHSSRTSSEQNSVDDENLQIEPRQKLGHPRILPNLPPLRLKKTPPRPPDVNSIGALRSPDDPTDRIYESIARAPSGHFVAAMPEVFDLRVFGLPARNQGKRGTCAAFTGSSIGEIHTGRAGSSTALSPEFIYYHRDTRPATGMYGRNVFQIMQTIGTVPERDYPYRRGEDAPIPDSSLYETASKHRIANFARVTTIDGLKRALLEIGPCYLQLPLYARRPEFWRKTSGEKTAGGHAVTVVGYDTVGFILRNSWGPKWGPTKDGHIIFPYTDWRRMWECWVPVDMVPTPGAEKKKEEKCSVM